MVSSINNLHDISHTFGSTATDLIDTSKAEKYMDEVRSYLPDRMEEQFLWAGVSEIVAGYSAYAFMTDIEPKACAEKIIEKLGVKQ